MADTIKYRFTMRRALAATWAALNSVLLEGEWGYEKDTGRAKVGDGVTAWNDLDYAVDDAPSDGNTYGRKDGAWEQVTATLLHHRRDDLTAVAGDDTITLAQEPHEDTLTIHKDGLLLATAAYAGVGSVVTLASPAAGGELFSVDFWSIEVASASTISQSTDPNWASVVSLLHFDGADGSTTFTDENGRVWTPTGNAQIDTAQSKFGGASALFDGAGDYLTTPSHADFDFGSGDFTIESWVRPTEVGTIVAKRTASTTQSGWTFVVTASGANRVAGFASWIGSGGTLLCNVIGATPLSATDFTHVAIAREGSAFRLFVNGVLDGSQTAAGTIAANTEPVYIGSNPQSDHYGGHIDDLRITKGVARYTANFTPPTAPFPNS